MPIAPRASSRSASCTHFPSGVDGRTESVPLGELKKLAEDRMLLFDEELMTYAMDQRRSNETLGDLTSSVSDLKDSLSGMQTAQSALEENGALKNEIQDLQEQIDTLLGTIDSLTAAGEQQPVTGGELFRRWGKADQIVAA